MKRRRAKPKSRKVKVTNKFGIHARPAALIVNMASRFKSEITIVNGETAVSGKSIMGLLTIEGYCGSSLVVMAEGVDATEALDAIEQLFKNKFDED